MKIEKLNFKDKAAQRVYNTYFSRIETTVKSLPKLEQADILMEMNSHIFEAVQKKGNDSELNSLLDSIDKLGAPEEVLKPLIADKKLEQATQTFNPVHVLKALALNIGNGVSYLIFSALYLSLFGFGFLIYAKLFIPTMGFYYKNSEYWVLGYKPSTAGYTELLGHWFIPVIILAIVVFYFLITLLLKLKRFLNNK